MFNQVEQKGKLDQNPTLINLLGTSAVWALLLAILLFLLRLILATLTAVLDEIYNETQFWTGIPRIVSRRFSMLIAVLAMILGTINLITSIRERVLLAEVSSRLLKK